MLQPPGAWLMHSTDTARGGKIRAAEYQMAIKDPHKYFPRAIRTPSVAPQTAHLKCASPHHIKQTAHGAYETTARVQFDTGDGSAPKAKASVEQTTAA